MQCNWCHRFQEAPFWHVHTNPKRLDLQKGSPESRFQKASLLFTKAAVFLHISLNDRRKTYTKLCVFIPKRINVDAEIRMQYYILTAFAFLFALISAIFAICKKNHLLIYFLKRKLEPWQINAQQNRHHKYWQKKPQFYRPIYIIKLLVYNSYPGILTE